MKRIAVYGAGDFGRTVISLLNNTKGIKVVMVCDSDKKRWGENYEGYSILKPESLFENGIEIDGVFIAIRTENNVEKYILKKKIKVYKKIEELVSKVIYWDISGKCNGMCRYCATGRRNLKESISSDSAYLKAERFKELYDYIYDKGLISKESELGLFNWKEPFMNPEIMDILSYCSNQNQKYVLSTNGSIVRKATEKNTYSKCSKVIFSMPGFSQKSYDRIHGFNFETIKKNIINMKDDMINHGFTGKFVINAHIYKFSVAEMPKLKEWGNSEGLTINSYYPYLAGNSMMKQYLENEIEDKLKECINDDLFLYWEKEINPKEIQKFENTLCYQMTIDEKGLLTLCCMADESCENYNTWGSVKEISSYEDYLDLKGKMLKCKTCKECKEYALEYRLFQH